MSGRSYPLFLPPEHLAEKGRLNWSKKEADEYFAWLQRSESDRVNHLLEFLGIDSRRERDRELLVEVGMELEELLLGDNFSSPMQGGATRNLTNQGLAIAADVGLLTAEVLLASAPESIHWEVVRRPKSDMSYNLPVLKGFGPMHLDPVGGSISEAKSVLNRQETGEIWAGIVDHWTTKVG